jgi:outer membrane lipoprotein SlyB
MRVAAFLLVACTPAVAWSASVDYGRITSVTQTSVSSSSAQTTGAILGGTVGLASGSGRSNSNRALRTVGGAAAGRQIGAVTSSRPVLEYQVLLTGGSSVRVVTDEAGLRVGDCVAVERGGSNNLRLVADERCDSRARPNPAALEEASACREAKDSLLRAETDAEFDRAERRVRLLCAD